MQIDSISRALGIETEDGKFQVIIDRNTAFPLVKHMRFTTSEDNQTTFHVRVYEGNNENTRDNLYLGEFMLENIKPDIKGVP